MEQLAASQTFRCILATVLAVGNFLNGCKVGALISSFVLSMFNVVLKINKYFVFLSHFNMLRPAVLSWVTLASCPRWEIRTPANPCCTTSVCYCYSSTHNPLTSTLTSLLLLKLARCVVKLTCVSWGCIRQHLSLWEDYLNNKKAEITNDWF